MGRFWWQTRMHHYVSCMAGTAVGKTTMRSGCQLAERKIGERKRSPQEALVCGQEVEALRYTCKATHRRVGRVEESRAANTGRATRDARHNPKSSRSPIPASQLKSPLVRAVVGRQVLSSAGQDLTDDRSPLWLTS